MSPPRETTPQSKALGENILRAIQRAGLNVSKVARNADLDRKTVVGACIGVAVSVDTLSRVSLTLGRGDLYLCLGHHFAGVHPACLEAAKRKAEDGKDGDA